MGANVKLGEKIRFPGPRRPPPDYITRNAIYPLPVELEHCEMI